MSAVPLFGTTDYKLERKTRVVQKNLKKQKTRKRENPNRVQNFWVGNVRSRPSEGAAVRAPYPRARTRL